MSNKMRALLALCVAGLLLGAALLFSTTAQASDNSATPTPASTTSITEKPNGTTVTNTTTEAKKDDPLNQWFAPGGIIGASLTGIFLIVREVNAGRNIQVQQYKDRALAAENKAALDTQRLSDQVTRLEKKLDDALKDTEAKHDMYLAEVMHRRKLELTLAEHGIIVPLTEEPPAA